MGNWIQTIINHRSETWIWDTIGAFLFVAVVAMIILTLWVVLQHGSEINEIHRLLEQSANNHSHTQAELHAICNATPGCKWPG